MSRWHSSGSSRRGVRLALVLLLAACAPAGAFDAFIQMTNGYFCDPASGAPWIPHGIAYQTWNRPLGVWQTYGQIDYDLDEMVKMGANSIRVDFVWQHIEEDADNQFKWENYDYLVQAAEQRGVRIFALIGYQWPPNWFPDEWYTMHPPGYDSGGIYHAGRWQSDIINYEHPQARAQYAEFFNAVCSRYKDSKAVAAWIVGNEYGYLGLWSGLLDGYDPQCEQAFRNWCQTKYGAITNANAAWGTSYTNFGQLSFPEQYRAYGVEGAVWADAVQWREESIASYTAAGAKAAKAADTNHLISYSTVGMQWGEEDWRYHAEDRGKITAACLATNAPIDFFSVNNYPWSILGHESQNGHWGVSYTKKVTGIPVLYTETGFSSSETLWPGMNEQRQGPLVRNSLWESLEVGAIGTHIFAWHDRPYITDREKGFGVLYANRMIKPAFWVSRDTYNLMEQVQIQNLLRGSQDPRPDIAFLWTPANHSQYNRYECEMQQMAGGLERLGYEPNFMNLDELGAGAYTNYKVIILPRNMRVEDVVPNSTNKTVLDFLRTVVIPKGIHVLASADLPAMQNFNGKPRAAFVSEVTNLFGIDASDVGGHEGAQNTGSWIGEFFSLITVRFTTNAVGAVSNGYTYAPQPWKYSDEVKVTNGGVLWAEMDSGRNKGFEEATNVVGWYTWGNTLIQTWFPMDGTNMLQMWGDSGIWRDFQAVPFGRYAASAYLRNNDDDPLRNGACVSVSIEWYDKNGNYLGVSESPLLATNTPGNSWVRYAVDDFSPSNTYEGRRVVRVGPTNLLANGGMTGSGTSPVGWTNWSEASHDPCTNVYAGTSGNSWQFWGDGGIYQDVTNGFSAGNLLKFGGYLSTPATDRLRNGTKYGVVQLEFYNGITLLSSTSASPVIGSSTTNDTWVPSGGEVTVPASADRVRFVVRCNDSTNGEGRFMADDVYLRNASRGDGSAFVDNLKYNPAVVVKNHGAGKSALFLYSVGDMDADGNNDGQMDVLPWKWRYDVLGSVIKDYFGVQPALYATGTNAYLCLPEYRTCTNGSILMQVKNYLYDTNQPNGGTNLVFTITTSLVTGKTLRAFEQCRIIETNSDGTFDISLPPDGQEMILAYAPSPVATSNMLVQIADAPAVVHPFGDQCYAVTVKYDTYGQTGLTLKVAYMEYGNNGDGVTNEIYQVLATNAVTGSGQNLYWMWIPDPDQTDSDYISTPDGGKYIFKAWLEDSSSNVLAQSLPQITQLEWGIRPTNTVPLSINKGDVTNMPVEWEDLYEQLYWQNTPLTRNAAFPGRVAVYRSTKTQALYTNQLDRVNAVCDWLESLGYSPGNAQDVGFDNVTVWPTGPTNMGDAVVVFFDDMEYGTNTWVATGLWHQVPGEYFSASNSWAYNNGTNYVTGSAANNGSLTTDWIDLTNAAVVSLTFKSWYETEDTGTAWDRKLVYASLDGTNWTPVLQAAGPSGQWASHAASLTAYAGKRIKLRFTFDTVDGAYNNYRGWLVDDVRVSVFNGTVVDLFADTMESTTNWTASGLWRPATNRAASGTNSWVYNNGTNFNTGARNSGALVSRWISLSDASSAMLTFKSWYRTEDTGTSWDRKLVYVSTNGTDWQHILQVSGPDQQWMTPSYDLGAYLGRQIRLKFFFDTIDALMNQYEGWYVDDVRITTVSGAGAATFADDTESGTNEWTAAGLWHTATDLCSSAANSWAYNNGTNFNTGARNSGALVSRWIDLTPASCVGLTFRSWYETEDAGVSWDRKLLYVTEDGTHWVQVLQVAGPAGQWRTFNYDLSGYAGRRIRLKFYFDSIDGVRNGYRGWYVDDVQVTLTGSRILFLDSFSGGMGTNWTRVAGSANWAGAGGTLRAWRIGNDDNMLCAGDPSWSNYTVSADLRYNAQGPYFNDAEVYLRYQNRDNYVKVGLRNFYGFWRVRYVVRVNTNFVAQAWLHDFSKTNQPVEDVWYNLQVRAETNTFTVFFDGENVGSFTDTNFPSGKIALGSLATQLGVWEPAKGYFFIDDDEYSYWSADEEEQVTLGRPLNLDWGYLRSFYPLLVLPSTYVMSDAEASNVSIWITNGFYSLLATDGGVAMKNETGADDPGRIEHLFGVGTVRTNLSGLVSVTVGTNVHYATLDYTADDQVSLAGSATAWTTVTNGLALNLGTMTNGSACAPALVCNVITARVGSPPKVFCFNYAVDAGGQLTNASKTLAQRAFEWLQSQTYRLTVELKYVVTPPNPNLDVVVFATNFWTLNGWGTNDLSIQIPMDNVMTGTNLYWAMYVYPWDGTNAWRTHKGFFSSGNETNYTTLYGFGLQVLGITADAYAGRDWDMWVAYNTWGSNLVAHFGIKEKGALENEDNFNDGNYTGWIVDTNANTNVLWTVTNGALRASVVSTGGWQYILRDGLSVTGRNITIEYNTRFMNDATNTGDGGLVYRGCKLYVNPRSCGWADTNATYTTNNRPTTNVWQHVAVHIRDGDPHWRSDLYVDSKPVFLAEPIQVTNWTSDTVGFVSPYYAGYEEWDNVRIVDEEYSITTQMVNGLVSPTNADFWPSVPDYDPDMWEFSDGTTLGAKYRWYIYFRGEGVHGGQDAKVYFSPRLMVEDTNFPVDMNWGDTVQVPVEWENLVATTLPVRLRLNLQNPYAGKTWTTNLLEITNTAGSMYCEVTLPTNIPAAGDYQWSAYLYPTGAADPWIERIGSDDTFRFDPAGLPVEPETIIWVHNAVTGKYTCYSDLGMPEPGYMDYFTWGGAHDGDYTNVPGIPEGSKCWKADLAGWDYAGWGSFHTNGLKDLSAYNYLKFWLKTEESSVKIQLEVPQGVQRTQYPDQVGWDPMKAGQWQELTIPVTNFGFANPLTNVYGSFLATLEYLPSYRYAAKSLNVSTTWVVGNGGLSGHGINIKCTTNGGTLWGGYSATNYLYTLWYNVDFADASNGWIVGGLDLVMRTTNGGMSWMRLTNGLPAGNYWYSLDFINSRTGWACGQTSIVKTTDGGLNWSYQFGASSIVRSIKFLNATNGWASGNGFMLQTVDGGSTWIYQIMPTNVYWWDLFFINTSTGWICGYNGQVCRTVDGGANWVIATNVPASSSQYLYGMTWADQSNGWIVGSGVSTNNMFFTHDGGVTWTNADSGLSATLLDVEFADANRGYAVGESVSIMRTTNGASTTPTWVDALPQARTFYVDDVRWTVTP